MSPALLGPRPYRCDTSQKPVDRTVLTIPLGASTVPIQALIGKTDFEDREMWQLIASPQASTETIGTLLGFLMLDAEEPLLRRELMPVTSPAAILLENGEFRVGRGYFLAPWATAEIARLARVLVEEHGAYVGRLLAALGQQEAHPFRPLLAGEVFSDSLESARMGPIPPPVEIDLSCT
jgi:hypothetical protein